MQTERTYVQTDMRVKPLAASATDALYRSFAKLPEALVATTHLQAIVPGCHAKLTGLR